MEYKFRLPIGDWPDNGHGKCDWYTISSSHPVEEVREMFFNACEKAGYDFTEKFCYDYQDSAITPEQAKTIPFDIHPYVNEIYEGDFYFEYDGFAKLFLDWIKHNNPEFSWKFAEEPPMLPFWGMDDKNRHIGQIGYGLF